jgi:hypothetical protein
MDLFLTLPSTSAHYITKLPERIHLDDQYEVGLSELVYPHTWYNVDNKDEIYWIGTYNLATNKLIKTFVKSGYYVNGEAFVSSLTHQATRVFADVPDIFVKFSISRQTNRVCIQIRNSNEYIIVLSWELMEFLGFREKVIAQKEVVLTGYRAFDVNRDFNLIYVYCDVAAYSTVGDTKDRLLRICNVSCEHDQVIHITYDQPHYVPVERLDFDTIGIAINNEVGNPMPFQFGISIATLHFRRRE